jgi:protein-disulfide isomerase
MLLAAAASGSEIRIDPATSRATVIVFISAQCPVSNAYNDRMSALYRDYSSRDVRFFFVNANQNEPASEVAAHSKSAAFPFPVLKDEGNTLADRFGAQLTPEVFVLGPSGTVVYQGAIDDNKNEARVKTHAARDAIEAVIAGRPVERADLKAFGCTIKRVRRGS